MNNPYETLGVPQTASESEIKKAYYKKAKTLHPDVNSSAQAEEEMKNINEAYEILSDPAKKRRYDSGGYYTWQERPRYGNYGGYQYDYSHNWDDFFEEVRKRNYESTGKRYETKTFNLFPLLILALVFFPAFYRIFVFLMIQFLAVLKLSAPHIPMILAVLFIYFLMIKRDLRGFFKLLSRALTWILFIFFMIFLFSNAVPLILIIFIFILLWYFM